MKKCTKCGENKNDNQFHNKRAQCKKCRSVYMEDYRKKNKSKILAKKKEWYYNLDQKERWERTKKSIEGRPESFLADQMYHIKSRSEKPEYPQNTSCSKKREFDLDRGYLRGLWEKQDGRCAVTNIQMVHKFGYLESVSIDRIDSSKGHVKDNIQLVCLAVNRMKNSHSNEDVSNFLRRVKDEIVRRDREGKLD